MHIIKWKKPLWKDYPLYDSSYMDSKKEMTIMYLVKLLH